MMYVAPCSHQLVYCPVTCVLVRLNGHTVIMKSFDGGNVNEREDSMSSKDPHKIIKKFGEFGAFFRNKSHLVRVISQLLLWL